MFSAAEPVTDPSEDVPFFRLVRDGLNGGVTGAAARDKFLGELAIIARALHLLGSRQDSRLNAVVTLLEKQLISSHQISLADNSLRIAELLYPYAALSNYIERIQFYEIWLDEFARVRQLIPDRPKFLDSEAKFILYMAGRSKLPSLVSDLGPPFTREHTILTLSSPTCSLTGTFILRTLASMPRQLAGLPRHCS